MTAAKTYVTPRELEVWTMAAMGKPNKEIAWLLGVTFKTVEKHRQAMARKLNIHSAAELVLEAVRRGVITVEVRPLRREIGAHGQERWML